MRVVFLISLLLGTSCLSLAAPTHSATRAVEHRPPIALEQPGDPAQTCPADINGDCLVNPVDLATLLGTWGPCPWEFRWV